MHTFLTGDLQVGKSTIIARFLEQTGLRVGGFKTVAQPWSETGSDIFLIPADGTGVFADENRIISRKRSESGCQMQVYPLVFDAKGASLLNKTSPCDLMIMDELGFTENDALAFQRAVFACLDGIRPVLGVVRSKQTPFLDRVRAHPKVRVIEVTTGNRQDVLRQLLQEWTSLSVKEAAVQEAFL